MPEHEDPSAAARDYTRRLRHEESVPWVAIRIELHRRGVDPQRTLMGAFIPEDTGMDCLILLPDGEIVEFELRWIGDFTEILGWEVIGEDEQFSWTDEIHSLRALRLEELG